jgi:hypothetical protein
MESEKSMPQLLKALGAVPLIKIKITPEILEPEPMKCSRCSSLRIMEISAKCKGLCWISLDGKIHDGHVPDNLNLSETINFGCGDYVALCICANCGQAQGDWPLPEGVMNNIDSS